MQTDKHSDNNTANTTGDKQNNKQDAKHPTPKETPPNSDIDESVLRKDEYEKFNKQTVKPEGK